MSTPTMHGYQITPGDEVDLDTAPDCCSSEMEPRPASDGERRYACSNCSTVVDIAATGLVSDIR